MEKNETTELTNAIRDAMFDLRAEFTKQDKFRAADVPVLTRNIMPHIIKMAMKTGDPVEFLTGDIVHEVGEISAALVESLYANNNESSRPGYVRWPIGQVLDIIHKILPEIVAGMVEEEDREYAFDLINSLRAVQDGMDQTVRRLVADGKRFGGKETTPPE